MNRGWTLIYYGDFKIGERVKFYLSTGCRYEKLNGRAMKSVSRVDYGKLYNIPTTHMAVPGITAWFKDPLKFHIIGEIIENDPYDVIDCGSFIFGNSYNARADDDYEYIEKGTFVKNIVKFEMDNDGLDYRYEDYIDLIVTDNNKDFAKAHLAHIWEVVDILVEVHPNKREIYEYFKDAPVVYKDVTTGCIKA